MSRVKRVSEFSLSLAIAAVACSSEISSSTPDAGGEAAGGGSSGASSSGSGVDASSQGSPDASGGTDSSPEAGTCALHENDAGTCNALEILGSVVTLACLSGEPPQPQGGTIEDGTYVIDTYVAYGTCPTTGLAGTTAWAICGNQWDIAFVNAINPADPDAGTYPIIRLNFETQAQGTTITYTQTCAANNVQSGGLSPRGYTAAPGRLTLIYPDAANAGTIYVSTYLRR